MSDATRAISLQEAVKAVGSAGDYKIVLEAAKAFNTFMTTADAVGAKVSVPGAEPAAPAARVPPKPVAAKPVAAKSPVKPVKAAKPVKTEEELAAELIAEAEAEQAAETEAEQAADEAEGGGEGATQDDVGQVISDLLAAKKRNEVISLLKKFKATSKSGVKPEDYDEFVAEGNELLAG